MTGEAGYFAPLFQHTGEIKTIGLFLSTIGSIALAGLALRSPGSIRRQVSPAWDDFGSETNVEEAAQGQAWAAFGFQALAVGLLIQLLHYLLISPHDLTGWVIVAGVLVLVLEGAVSQGRLRAQKIQQRLRGGENEGGDAGPE